MARVLSPAWIPSTPERLAITGRVVTALILRETKTRFGRSKAGYLWAVVEPMFYVVFFVAIRDALATTIPFGEDIVLFMVGGLLTFRVFIAISGGMMGAISSNKALLTYPPVKPTDVILARFILETITMLFVMAVFFLGLSLVTEKAIIPNHENFAAAIGMTVLLGAGLGTFNAVLAALWPTWTNVFGLLRLPLFILSGIFYVPKGMPLEAQTVLWWNPVLHCVEWLRTGTYLTYDPMLSIPYVLGVAVVLLVTGLTLERVYRFHLLSN